jgi:hypothetical protein
MGGPCRGHLLKAEAGYFSYCRTSIAIVAIPAQQTAGVLEKAAVAKTRPGPMCIGNDHKS